MSERTLRALIADDEAPARRKLRDMLEAEPDVAVVGEAGDGDEAVALIAETRPDVVFLDVQMPRRDGFGVIAAVGVEAMPLVVFVTAFDEHALHAFEVHALDYLLKPFAPSRFRAMLGRVRRQLAGPPGPSPDLARRIADLLAAAAPAPGPLRQLLAERGDRGGDRQVLLAVETIDRIEAERNYLRLFTRDGEYRRRGTLQALEARLDPERFQRINRSEIVRLEAVREIQPWFHGDLRLVMRDGTVLSLSRRFRARFVERL